MTEHEYTDALKKARTEIEELVRKRADLDKRIATLQVTIDGLTVLSDKTDHSKDLPQAEIQESIGITDAIRTVLRQSRIPMTAPQIRDALIDLGYDVERYASILTVIHNTVKRMNDQKEIVIAQDGFKRFKGWRYREPDDKK